MVLACVFCHSASRLCETANILRTALSKRFPNFPATVSEPFGKYNNFHQCLPRTGRASLYRSFDVDSRDRQSPRNFAIFAERRREGRPEPPSRTTFFVALIRLCERSGRLRRPSQTSEPAALHRSLSPGSSTLPGRCGCCNRPHRSCAPTS